MSSLNKALIIGRLGQNPELRHTQSGTAVATLSIATNERWKDNNGEYQERTEWHRVVAWGRTAEICQEYLSKGSLVYIEGTIQTRKWEDKDGNEKYTTEIKALSMQMLDSKGTGQAPDKSVDGYPKSSQQRNPTSPPDDFPTDEEDDGLPFMWLTPLLIPALYSMQAFI